jgi:drug/metabolite transporter (DMT)-like permease
MKRFSGYLFLTGAFSLAGTVVVTARLLCGKLGVFTIGAGGLFFALCAILPFRMRSIIKAARGCSVKDWANMAFQAATGIFLYRMFMLLGLERTSTLEAGLLLGATPAVTVALARIFLKERLRPLKLAGLGCTCAGIAALQADFTSSVSFSWEHVAGNALVLCAAACESCFNVFSRRDSLRRNAGPIDRTACVVAIAFTLCLVPALFEAPAERVAALDIPGWLGLVWYGVGATAIAYVMFYAGIARCDAGTAAAFSGMIPFTAFLLSVLVLGESAGLPQILGGVFVIAGILMISGIKQKYGMPREIAVKLQD